MAANEECPLNSCAFRELEEKQTSSNILHMAWSPKMDLIALANEKGEIILHRLSWQRVWVHQEAEGQKGKPGGLAFKPDGKALAVGYISGFCRILDVENAKSLHSFWIKSGVRHLQWIQSETFTRLKAKSIPFVHSLNEDFPNYCDPDDSELRILQREERDSYSVLLIAAENCDVHLYAQGIHHIGHLHCFADSQKFLNEDMSRGKVASVSICSNMTLLSVVIELKPSTGERKAVYLLTYDTSLIQKHQMELFQVSNNITEVWSLTEDLGRAIMQMTESWEDILLEMDTKLCKVADDSAKSRGCALSNDFLRLMMLGHASAELESFLLMELTDKGVKKLGLSIKDTYSKIQHLILEKLHRRTLSLIYVLIEVQGMSRWPERFALLGIRSEEVQLVLNNAIVFLLKSWELMQVIDSSLSTLRTFFQWLLMEIHQLSKEQVPTGIRQKVQEQTKFLAEFIVENFSDDPHKHKFKLERVGQYFREGKVKDSPTWKNVPWLDFLKEAGLGHNEMIGLYPLHKEDSLVQSMKALKSSVDALQCVASKVITENCPLRSVNLLFKPKADEYRVSQATQMCNNSFFLLTAFTCDKLPSERFLFLKQSAAVEDLEKVPMYAIFRFNRDEMEDENSCSLDQSMSVRSCQVISLSFFDNDTVTFLLEEGLSDSADFSAGNISSTEKTILAQISLNKLQQQLKIKPPNTTFWDQLRMCGATNLWLGLTEGKTRVFSHQQPLELAVNGTRKVAAVLFSSLRRVRLFVMDTEDDEDDDNDTTNEVSNLSEAQGGDSHPDQLANDDKENSTAVQASAW